MESLNSLKPMLLSEVLEPFDDKDYIYELKFDGFRTIIHVNTKEIHILSRNGHDVTKLYPELKSICNLVKKETIFDGEIISFKDGIPSFSNLQRRNVLKDISKIEALSKKAPIAFVAFDILYEGKSLTELPLLKRKKILDKYDETDFFVKTKFVIKDGKKLFKRVVDLGLEGIVAKKKDSLYYPGMRTKDWIKIKNFKDGIFLIGGYTVNKLTASLLLGQRRDKNLYYVGKVSIGLDSELYKKVAKLKKRTSSPFKDHKDEGEIYVLPKLNCEVEFTEWTDSKHLRHPIFKREVRKDESND